MKKWSLATLSLGLLSLVSCSNDEPANGAVQPVQTTGAFVVCDGFLSTGIPGSITSYDFSTGTATLNAFSKVNGRHLGSSAEEAIVAGDYLFIVSTNENTVEIADKNTLKSIQAINMIATFGDDKGDKPRSLLVKDDKLFISTFSGFVCSYDYKNLKPLNTYKAGSYPEGMAFFNGKLFVANSGYGMGLNPSLSVIDITSGDSYEITDENIRNPKSLYVVQNKLFLLDGGEYDASWNQTETNLYSVEPSADNKNVNLSKICSATYAAASNKIIAVINAPWHTPVVRPTYGFYDVASGTFSILDITVDSPAFIGIDPMSEDIFLGSYKADPATGYAAYGENGYVNIYSASKNYTVAGSFTCGVGPRSITFNTEF